MQSSTTTVPWWRIQYTESDVESITKALREEHISLGPVTREFESRLAEKLSVPYVVATTSGSVAILMSLIALGIRHGDEVIIPNRTWIAAAHATMMLGAKVVLVDVLEDRPIMDTALIEEKITSRTKAIIATALNGRVVNLAQIKSLARKHKLFVIEDAAQAIFSYEDSFFAGTQSDLGCYSFSVAKLIPTGQGGCVVTSDNNLYQELIKIRTHGVASLLDCSYSRFGFNFRFTDLQAAIGLTQLASLDYKVDKITKIYHMYQEGLKGCSKIRLIQNDLSQGELPLYIEILTPERQKLIEFLTCKNIQVKEFYPNLNRAKYFGCHDIFPKADVFEAQGLTLPCGPDQSLKSIAYVINSLHCYEEMRTMDNVLS